MESDLGKLFIGGISWDTNEDRLRDYFKNFGEVVEAVIMRDRVTGRARGFGFVVFADPNVAEFVVMEKHTIDGRTVEAKKAVPRDDPHGLNRSNGSPAVHGSPGPAHAKKIFVGGLPSTVTEGDFRKYFEQFGTIMDVVVMYDHNTQRPRGFGFITYDSEDAVDKVLLKTFHELNGKMVEVKRAVPKELSPASNMRSAVGGHNYSLNRVTNFLNGYVHGYNLGASSGLSPRIDSRFAPISARNAYTPLAANGYGMGMNFEPRLSPNYAGTGNYNSGIGYGRTLSPFYNENPTRYNSPMGYASSQGGMSPMINSSGRNIWNSGSPNYSANHANSNAFLNTGIWGGNTYSILAESGLRGPAYTNENLSYGTDESLGLGETIYSRRKGSADLSSIAVNDLYEGAYTDICGGSSAYGNSAWGSSSGDLEGSGQLSYDFGRAASENTDKNSAGFVNGYNVTNRQSDRGIAA